MDLIMTYDRGVDAWTLVHDAVVVRTEDDVGRWEALLRRELAKVRGARVYLLIDVSGVTLDPSIMKSYSRVVKDVVMTKVLGVVRYGAATQLTTATIRLGAITNRFPSHLFPNRAAAIEALAHVRTLPEAAQ